VLTREQPLELRAVVAGGAAEQRDPRGIEIELVVVERPDRVGHLPARRAPVGETRRRYSAGIISAGVAARKYLLINGCVLISRRVSIASCVARPTSSYPSSSICRRARSIEAMICRFGEVEVWVKNASLKEASTVWKS